METQLARPSECRVLASYGLRIANSDPSCIETYLHSLCVWNAAGELFVRVRTSLHPHRVFTLEQKTAAVRSGSGGEKVL